jgi:hypothetical protein
MRAKENKDARLEAEKECAYIDRARTVRAEDPASPMLMKRCQITGFRLPNGHQYLRVSIKLEPDKWVEADLTPMCVCNGTINECREGLDLRIMILFYARFQFSLLWE